MNGAILRMWDFNIITTKSHVLIMVVELRLYYGLRVPHVFFVWAAADAFANAISDMNSALTDGLYISYIMGGAQYGKTEAGFRRWMDEWEATQDAPTQ